MPDRIPDKAVEAAARHCCAWPEELWEFLTEDEQDAERARAKAVLSAALDACPVLIRSQEDLDRLPLATVEHHCDHRTRRLAIRVNGELAYDGPWNEHLQALLDSHTNAVLFRAALRSLSEDET